MRVNALVTERLPGDVPLTRDLLKMLEGRRQRRHERRRAGDVRARARAARRAAPPRGVSTPPDARGILINTWIASELVSTLLERRLADEGVRHRLLRNAERDRRLGAAHAEQGRRVHGHAADDGLRPPSGGWSRTATSSGSRIPATAGRTSSSSPRRATRTGSRAGRHSSATIAEVTANLDGPVDDVEGSLEDLIEALRKSANGT